MPRLWCVSLTVGSQLKGLRVIDPRVTLASDEGAGRDLTPVLFLLRMNVLNEI